MFKNHVQPDNDIERYPAKLMPYILQMKVVPTARVGTRDDAIFTEAGLIKSNGIIAAQASNFSFH